ncbi:MAG: hypothetical protein V4582_25175 [Pseudomonadota bacterium]
MHTPSSIPKRAARLLALVATLACHGACAAAPVIGVRFDQTQFPPTVHKFGFNATWTNADTDNKEGIDAAALAGAPMAAALLSTKPPADKFPDPDHKSTLKGLFSMSGGAIVGHANSQLTALRAQTAGRGMLNFLQLAGAPNYLDFSFDPSAQKPAHGNWYPLPTQLPALANAFGSLAAAIDAADHAPTIWSFWQEPEHTLDKRLSNDESVSRYLDFFALMGPELRRRLPDASVAGIQMNCAGGESSPNSKAGGSKLKAFARMLQEREAAQGHARYPLDYLSIQNYRGETSALCIQSTRKAFASARFDGVPLIFNEWDFDIPRGGERIDRAKHFEQQYKHPDEVIKLAGLLKDMIDQPDLHYALLMRDVFRADVLARAPVAFLNAMSELRRPLRLPPPGTGVDGVAAGDDEGAQVMLWNADPAGARQFDLALGALGTGATGAGKVARVVTLAPLQENGKWRWQRSEITLKAEHPDLAIAGLTIPSRGFVLIEAGAPQGPGRLIHARYLGQRNLVERGENNHGEAPHGMGFYDVRSNTLVASADGPAGAGMGGVLLAGVGTDPRFATIRVDIASSGLGVPGQRATIGVRVNYLDGQRVIGSLVHQNGATFTWPRRAQSTATESLPSATAHQFTLEQGATTLALEVEKYAPAAWAGADGGARRLELMLAVVPTTGAATARARLANDGTGAAP